jgi:hypothetical protein
LPIVPAHLRGRLWCEIGFGGRSKALVWISQSG